MTPRGINRLVSFGRKTLSLAREEFRQAKQRASLWRLLSQSKAIYCSTTGSTPTEIISLVSHNDLLLYLVCIKTLSFFSKRALPITVVDDGTMTKNDHSLLRQHIRGVRYISRNVADRAVKICYRKYPLCRQYRLHHATVRKHLDLPFLSSRPKTLLLDSDLLFFSKPTLLLKHINDKSVDRVVYSQNDINAYAISKLEAKHHFKRKLINRLNGGLILFPSHLHDLNLAEQLFKYVEKEGLFRKLFMQTYPALLFSDLPSKQRILLPDNDYQLNLDKSTNKKAISRHYINIPPYVRNLFFSDGQLILQKIIDQERSLSK